jgi:CIC family chloride channel protein
MRTLVGCGSAGAIGAAFGAPLTGAFYAFELIVGTYTPFGLAPIAAAAISGALVSRLVGTGHSFLGRMNATSNLSEVDMITILVLAIVCAGAGIGIMRAVTVVEDLFKRSRLPLFLQPVIGGLVVGSLALVTPQVLASGHGALFQLFRENAIEIFSLIVVFFLKAIASSISIGSGFRGGLFFASLFLGGLIGKIYAGLVLFIHPSLMIDPSVCTAIGMAALAVAIVGGPLTMSFLALETTGDFTLIIMTLAAATIVSVIVRRNFGYSFATWRLHLRGESIRGAHDVGWMRALTVERMMRADVQTARSDMTIGQFRDEFPLGSAHWVSAVDAHGRYAGMISVAEAHLAASENNESEESLDDLLRYQDDVLLPQMNIKAAADIFEHSESDALAVIDDRKNRHVIGLLTEAFVLRRYTEELDKARRDLAGETWLQAR